MSDMRLAGGCKNCIPHWGNIGLCKRHTPIHTIQHMGLFRWAWVWVVHGGKMFIGTVLPKIIKLVVVTVLVAIVTGIAIIGARKQQVVICNELQSYSQTHAPYFFLTPSEKAMCDGLGVTIDAPVK